MIGGFSMSTHRKEEHTAHKQLLNMINRRYPKFTGNGTKEMRALLETKRALSCQVSSGLRYSSLRRRWIFETIMVPTNRIMNSSAQIRPFNLRTAQSATAAYRSARAHAPLMIIGNHEGNGLSMASIPPLLAYCPPSTAIHSGRQSKERFV